MNRIDEAVLNSQPIQEMMAALDAIECLHERSETRNKGFVTVEQCLICGETLWQLDVFEESAPPFDWPLLQENLKRRDESVAEIRKNLGWIATSLSEIYRQVYSDYLKSSQWQGLRAEVMQRSAGVCELCGINTATEVHHLNYRNAGNESLKDLAAVCRACHKEQHRNGGAL